MKFLNYIKENKTFLIAVVLTTVIYFGGAYLVIYDSVHTREEIIELESNISHDHYNEILHEIFHNVELIETYVETIGVDNITNQSFEDFAISSEISKSEYVSISIAPDGILEYYYSPLGLEGLIGRDLINDEREHVRESIAYSIENKTVVVNGPFDLILGDKGIVFRKPIFEEDEFVAIINYVLDYNVLNEALHQGDSVSVNTAIYDENNELVFGTIPFSENMLSIDKIELEYVDWSIGITVNEEFEKRAVRVTSLLGTGLTILYLAVFVLWHRYYSKNRKLVAHQNILINYDNLTNLPNRRLFEDETKELIKSNTEFFLGFGDLDNFKNINDVLGHSVGDQYLSFVSDQFKMLITDDFKIYRWGGDEFIFVLCNTLKSEVRPRLDDIFDIFKTPFDINGSKHQISISVGVVHYPTDGHSIDELVKRADIVMYDIKAHYKNTYSFFEERYLNQLYAQIEFQQKLDAFEIEDFEIFYQPIINIETGKITGFEGLSRLFDKDGTLLNTYNIIKQYEQDGTITNLDKYVFHNVCYNLKKLEQECDDSYFMTFNISPLSLNNDYIDYLERTMNSYNVNPNKITIEIIETLGFKDVRFSVDLLNRIKSLGFKIAMDDFGMGYSSLSYIAKLPLDMIKIDKTFIHTYKTDEFNKTILYAIQDISETLHLETLVEGIETEEQLEFVKKLGATYYQGYYHSKPHGMDKLITMIQEEKKSLE